MPDKQILFSDPAEAVTEARQIFARDAETEWVIATGAATVGGTFYEGVKGDLIMHRSELAMWTEGKSVEAWCKATILAALGKLGR